MVRLENNTDEQDDVIISFNRGLTSGGDKSGVLVMCVRLSNIVLLEFFASNDAMKNYMYINPGTSWISSQHLISIKRSILEFKH